MLEDHPAMTKILKEHGYSVTEARRQVFNALNDSGPLTMSQLIRKLQHKINRASIYRTIELFEKLNIVNRLQIGWKYTIELSDLFTDHHHHASCMQCGQVISFEEDEAFEKHITKLADKLEFKLTSHSLELRGLCSACAQGNIDPLAHIA